jgi:hypothetical protein
MEKMQSQLAVNNDKNPNVRSDLRNTRSCTLFGKLIRVVKRKNFQSSEDLSYKEKQVIETGPHPAEYSNDSLATIESSLALNLARHRIIHRTYAVGRKAFGLDVVI